MNHSSQPPVKGGRRGPKVAVGALVSSALAAGIVFHEQPARAYYYPYYGRGGFNFLYPLRYLAYPLLLGGGPYSAWTSASLYRRLTTGALPGYPYMYGPQMLKNYSDEEPLNSPRKRVKQKRLGQEFGVDEIAHAQWADGDSDGEAGAQSTGAAPGAIPYGGRPDYFQGATPGQLTALGPAASTGAGAPGQFQAGAPGQFPAGAPGQVFTGFSPNGNPPLPPQMVSNQAIALAPNRLSANPTAASSGMGAPLAVGFVNLINSKFEGNIEAALFDPEARSWAKVLGIVQDDNLFGTDFSETRVQLIKQILGDQSLDAVSKLSAVKILLHGSAGTNANPNPSPNPPPQSNSN